MNRINLNKLSMIKINKLLDLLWARKNVQGEWELELIDNLRTVVEKLAEELGYEVDIWEGEINKVSTKVQKDSK